MAILQSLPAKSPQNPNCKRWSMHRFSPPPKNTTTGARGLKSLLAELRKIRFWLIELMFRMMRISSMILMNLIILMLLMILS